MNEAGASAGRADLNAPKARPSPWRIAWRVFWWGSTILGAWVLVLMFRSVPLPRVAVSHQAAESAADKLERLAPRSAADAGDDGESRRIALTEEEANSFLAMRMGLADGGVGAPPGGGFGASLRDVKVAFGGDTLAVFSVFNLMGKDLTLELDGRLHVAEGYMRFEATGGRLGACALPQSAASALVARLMENPASADAFRMPPEIHDVRVENGELVIERR